MTSGVVPCSSPVPNIPAGSGHARREEGMVLSTFGHLGLSLHFSRTLGVQNWLCPLVMGQSNLLPLFWVVGAQGL